MSNLLRCPEDVIALAVQSLPSSKKASLLLSLFANALSSLIKSKRKLLITFKIPYNLFSSVTVNPFRWTKFRHKWMVVALVLVLVAANGSRAAEIPNKPPPTVSPPKKTGPKINQHILIVLGCVLILLLLICFFIFYIRRCAEKQLALAANTGYHSQRSSMKIAIAHGLDPAVIAAFTSFMYSSLLPECSHVFHRECIDEWLGLHVTCPVCRASLVPKPNNESESCCGPNAPLNSHVSVKVTDLKHDMLPRRKCSRSYSMGHLVVRQPVGNVERYTLMLPKEAQYFLDNSTANPSTSLDVMFPMENGLKHCLKSASVNFVRGSDYFDYERLKTIV